MPVGTTRPPSKCYECLKCFGFHPHPLCLGSDFLDSISVQQNSVEGKAKRSVSTWNQERHVHVPLFLPLSFPYSSYMDNDAALAGDHGKDWPVHSIVVVGHST